MPSLKRLLKNFSREERLIIDDVISSILLHRLENLDIKKLKGYQNVFRVRKGKIRIIFSNINSDIRFLAIDRRSDNTYNLLTLG